MAGANAQRTSYQAAESLGATWSVSWGYRFSSGLSPAELIYPGLDPIVASGHVLVPTLMGKLRAFQTGLAAAGGGTIQWTATVGAPIVCTPAADTTNVYVADAYGRLSAWRLTDGVNVWGPVQITNGTPFRGAVLLADSKLLLGGADGTFYAVNPTTGAVLWSTALGGMKPILGGAAWSAASGVNTVYVAAEDMRVRAFNSGTGALIATSAVLPGSTFSLFWPVIKESSNMLVIRAQPQYPALGFSYAGAPPYRGIEADVSVAGQQDSVLAAYDATPSNYATNLHLLNLTTLATLPSTMHWHYVYGHGSLPAPCLDRNGYMIIPFKVPPSVAVGQYAQFARVDLATRKVVDYLWDGTPLSQDNAPDENEFASACATGIWALHCQETNAAKSGFWRQPANAWISTPAGPPDNQMFYNHQGPSAGPGVISGGMGYHLAQYHRLLAWRTL